MAALPLIYIGALQYEGRDAPNIYKVDSADNDFGTISLGADNMASPATIRGDASGNVYFATERDTISGHSIFKYHRDGQLLWSANHGSTLRGVAIDDEKNVYGCGYPANGSEMYFSGSRSGYYTLRKWNEAGELQWSIDGEPTAVNPGNYDYDSSVAVCPDGDIVVGSVTISEPGVIGGIRKHSAETGELLWQWNNDATEYGLSMRFVAVDDDGVIYGADDTGANAAWVVALDSGGELLWSRSVEPGRRLFDFCMANGEIVLLTYHGTSSSWPGNLIKLSAADGTTIWDGSNGTEVLDWPYARRMAIDLDGRLYIAANNGFYNAYDSDGQLLWGGTIIVEGSGPILTCLVAVETEIPALKIPLGFGVPTIIGDLYTLVSALPIALSLSAPKARLEYVGTDPLPSVYRVYLSGSPDLELSVSSFSCRRGDGGIVLSLSCPVDDSVTVDDIVDRADGDLVVKSGIRFRDGTEQLSEIFRAGYSSLRWNEGATTATLVLEGKSDGIAEDPKTRALSGIAAYRISDGNREIECAIDYFLEPGDTADLGDGETFIVGQVVYNVSPTRAYMTVSEIPS